MKTRKLLVVLLAFVLALACVALIACDGQTGDKILVTFQGQGDAVELVQGGEISVPKVQLKAGEVLKGWATSENATTAKFKSSTIAYDDLIQYATDGKITLYPVIDNQITVTVKGIEDKTTVLSSSTKNTAAVLIGESSRQSHLGYATTADATTATIGADVVLNYQNLAQYADSNAQLTLYPVIKTYDLMIAVHASHSNGKVYVSDEQFAEIKVILANYFAADNIEILVERFDLLSAASFAKKVVEKDYDLTLSSKSINEDLETAKAGMGLSKAYTMVALSCIDLNQSRQVGVIVGHDNAELYPYAGAAYTCLTTPLDKVLTVKFDGDDNTYEVHRTGDEVAFPGAVPEGKVLVGYSTVQGSSEVEIVKVIYTTIAGLGVDGTVTLYPIFEKLDLAVYVWCGQSKGGTTYVTEEEVAQIKAEFIASLGDAATGKNIVFHCIWGKTEAYGAQVGNDAMVIISGQNLATDAQCGKLLADAAHSKVAVINKKFESGSTRYVGVTKAAEENELAIALLKFLCEATVEVTIAGEQPAIVNSLTGNEIEPATLPQEPAGKLFAGWATTENATEVQVAKITYANVASLATNGKVTLYPVFVNVPDLYVIVWGQNGTSTYVTEEEHNTMVAGFNAYLQAKGVDVSDKNIVIEYSTIKGTAAFYAEIEKPYINVIVGASAISNDTYAAHWTIDMNYYAKAVNFVTKNNNRYVGLRAGVAESNELAVLFFNYMCESVIEVTIGDGQPAIVNSLSGNEIEYTGEIPEGKILVGFATTENATEAQVAKITYAALKDIATNGKITLYPVFEKIDLVVYVWGGQSKTGTNIYVTEEETEQLKADFIAMLGEKAADKKIVFHCVWGKTADYGALVGNDAMVIISGQNLATDAQCGALLADATYAKVAVVNRTFESGSTRYVGVTKAAEANELAIALLDYLCEKTITVNGVAAEAQIVSLVRENELEVAVEVPEGKIFHGWATTADATEAQITKICYATVKDLATDGTITLYPVFTSEPVVVPDLIINILCGNSSSTYITEEEVATIAGKFVAYLTAKGDENAANYVIVVRSNPGASGANFLAGLQGDESVLLGASNLNPTLHSEGTWTNIINRDAIANGSRYCGVVATCSDDNLALAKLFVKFLTDDEIAVTVGETTEIVGFLAANELTIDVEAPEGKLFVGWATTADATEAQITKISYATVKNIATNGAVTLYPVFADASEPQHGPDLVVYILCGTGTSNNNQYNKITLNEVNALLGKFTEWLKAYDNGSWADRVDSLDIQIRHHSGESGANFNASCQGDESILIGAGNLKSQDGFVGMYEGHEWTTVTNKSAFADSSRAAGVVATCNEQQLALADLFMLFLTSAN